MARPPLEIWRDLNRDRDREPSSLLRQTIAKLGREMASPEYQARMRLKRATEPKPLSPVERVVREMASPEWQEKWRKRQAFLKACGVTERVLGTPRPVSTAQPDKRKRKTGGRPHSLTPEEIERGINLLRDRPKMTLTSAWQKLNAAGIKASKSTIYRDVFKPAHARS